MKKLVPFFTFIIIATSAFTQVVTTDPAFPTINSSITVFFHSDQGSMGLKDYAGTDVYAHAGVITNASASNSDWKHAPTWLDNSAKYKLNKISPNLYSLVISNVKTYYNITDPNEQVLKLAFVFRNGTGSKEGKGTGNTDIFVDLYSGSINVKLNKPVTPFQFVNLNDQVPVEVIASTSIGSVDKMILYKNGIEFTQVSNDTLITSLTADESGRTDVKIVASNSSNDKDSVSFYYVVNPPVVNAPLPNGVRDGINKIGENAVTFSLMAPYKKFVYLIGDFNNWEVDPNYYMNRDSIKADSVRWWITIDNLNPDTEYAFQYLVDGTIKIADPYSEKVLNPGDDSYIPASVYPNLKPYPTGKTTSSVSTFKINETIYNWNVTNFQKPDKKNLIVYELLVRDFVATHSYQTLIDTLQYLKKLGINAIELMPVNEFEGNESWGYNPSFHLALDKYYGTKNKFKEFIDVCHQNGIAVILDAVLNHAFGQSPLIRLWDTAPGQPSAQNIYANVTAKHPYNVGADLNHESKATQYFFNRVVEYWLTEYKVDGFRFDLSKGFTQKNSGSDVGLWGQYDASRIAIWKKYSNMIWTVTPDAYVILEHFADNSEEIELSNAGMMLWGNINHDYNEATMGWVNTSNFSWVSYKQRGWTQPNVVGYMESHDEERLMVKNKLYGNSANPNHDVKELAIALNRNKLAAAFFLTIPGPKMIWQFGELGYDISIDFNGRLGNKPNKTNEYWADLKRRNLYKTYAALLKLRNENPVFGTTNYSLVAGGSIKTLKLTDASMNVAIIGNFDVTAKSGSAGFQNTGWWYDYFKGDSIEVSDVNMQFNLIPGEFKIFTTKRLSVPESGIAVDVEENDNEIPTSISLNQNYPNPFNPTTKIEYSIAGAGNVTLKVFDLLGREVGTLVNQSKQAGNYSVEFDASQLSSGVYIYQLKSGNTLLTKKMIVVK